MEDAGIGRHPFSKSSFNTYYRCPRAYMFSCLVSTPDQKHTEFGNLIHEFAEMYFCHRGVVDKDDLDEFIGRIFDRYAGLSSPLLIDMDRGRIKRAMSNIMAYIDRYAPESPILDRKLDDTHRNRIMSASGLGLAIVKHTAALMGGTITLYSKPGIGTTITVSFPAAAD